VRSFGHTRSSVPAPGRLAVAHIHPYTFCSGLSRQSLSHVEIPPSRQIRLHLQRKPHRPRSVFSPPLEDKTRLVNVGTTPPHLHAPLVETAAQNPTGPEPDQLLSLLADWRPTTGPTNGIKRAASGHGQGCRPLGRQPAGEFNLVTEPRPQARERLNSRPIDVNNIELC